MMAIKFGIFRNTNFLQVDKTNYSVRFKFGRILASIRTHLSNTNNIFRVPIFFGLSAGHGI